MPIKHLLIKFFIFILLPFSLLADLSLIQIRPTMDEIFSYHVENRQMSPLLVRRAFRLYIEQFDPSRTYLLKEEVKPYFEISDAKAEEVIYRYYQDDFSDFIQLNSVLEKAIQRARNYRSVDQQMVLQEDSVKASKKKLAKYVDYSGTENELRGRILSEQMAWMNFEFLEHPDLAFSKENKEKIFHLWERKKRSQEDPYLYTAQMVSDHRSRQHSPDYYLALHILKALSRSLDAHSAFFSPQEAFEIRASLKKQLEGVGVVLKESINGVYVAELVPNGPAYKSGLVRVGDYLEEIDGKKVKNITFEELAETIKGPAGSFISLTLTRRPDLSRSELIEVKLRREKIIMEDERLSFAYEPFADGIIGKISLPSFYDSGDGVTAENDLKNAIRMLKKEGNLLGLIIDLRENSGGFLTQAVNIASLFIQKGIIVISKYADGEIRYARDIDAKLFFKGPVILLTSKASASASEIVAQALQDYGVAFIVGDNRTYGKGSMQYQTITDEKAYSFYKVTVGRYYTASGRSTQIEGVHCDIHVPTKYAPYNIGERFLEYPLSSDTIEFSIFENLKDIDRTTYKTFKEEFLPYLPSRETEWQKMLPKIRENSEKRLATDQNFQYFLHGKQSKEPVLSLYHPSEKKTDDFGKDDLQMKECINIVKDMIVIHSSSPSLNIK